MNLRNFIYPIFLVITIFTVFASEEGEFDAAVNRYFLRLDSGLLSKEGAFFESDEYLAEAQVVCKKLEENPLLSSPIVGIVGMKVMAQRIAIAPIKSSYSPREITYIARQMMGLSMMIQSHMNTFQWVPHELRDIKEKDYVLAQANLESEEEETRAEALKIILYTHIPWRQLEMIGHYGHDFVEGRFNYSLLDENIFEAISDFKSLTHHFQALVNFYCKDFSIIPERPTFPFINDFGSFLRDGYTTRRFNSVLTSFFYDFPNSIYSERTKRYALLRILSIIGEGGILLSTGTKNKLATDASFRCLQAIRNFFHDPIKHQFLQRVVVDEGLLCDEIFADLSRFKECLGNSSVEALELRSIINLKRMISGHLTLDEEEDLESHVGGFIDSFNRTLKSVEAMLLSEDLVDQNVFESALTNLSKSSKKKLMEFFKKRKKRQKDGESSILTPEEIKKLSGIVGKLTKDEEPLLEAIKRLHTYTWRSLEQFLVNQGAGSEEALSVWQNYHERIIERRQSRGSPSERGSTRNKVAFLSREVLQGLDLIRNTLTPYQNVPLDDRITRYQSDPITQLALEYLIGNFRDSAQKLWDILAADDNKRYAKEISLLDFYIQRAKDIHHNHDITEISTRTRHGHNLVSILTDIPALFGDSLQILFPLPQDVYITFEKFDGEVIRIPIYDVRRNLSKRQFKKLYPANFKSAPLKRAIMKQLGIMANADHLGFARSLYSHLEWYQGRCLKYSPLPQRPSLYT